MNPPHKIPDGIILSVKSCHLNDEERQFFSRKKPLGFVLFKRNFESKKQVAQLIKELRSVTQNKNILIFVDQEGGRVQRFNNHEFFKYSPQQIFGKLYLKNKTLAKKLSYFSAYLMGNELKDIGVDIDFSPVCDIFFQFGDDVIGDRAFSSDPKVVMDLSRKFCQGLRDSGIMPVPKHFPGHGRSKKDTHKEVSIVDIDLKELIKTDLIPFKILNNESLVMLAHIIYSKIDNKVCTYSRTIIFEILRKRLNFKGLVLSDDISMKALSGQFEEKILNSYKGGCDIILYCSGNLKEMIEIYRFIRPIKKKYFNYFFKDLYRIKKKEINLNEIIKKLSEYNLIISHET